MRIINVSVLPKISPFDFGEAAIFAGEAAQVSCFVTEGDQPIDISWSFNGSDVSSMNGVSTTKAGRKASTLVIDPALSSHRGSYTCTARNRAGAANFTATLNVNGTPDLLSSLHPISFPFPSIAPLKFPSVFSGVSEVADGIFET